MALLAPIRLRVAALTLLFAAVISCSGDWITIDAAAPLDRIVLSPSGEAFVHARPEEELQELISIKPFLEMGLRPGMTGEEAEERLGSPDYMATERHGQDKIFGYRSPEGAFQVVKQRVSSEGSEIDRWFVRFQPRRCMELIDPRIVEQLQDLDPFPRSMRLIVGPEQTGVVSIYFEGKTSCSTIWWLAEAPPSDQRPTGSSSGTSTPAR